MKYTPIAVILALSTFFAPSAQADSATTTNIDIATNNSWTESSVYGWPIVGGAAIAAVPTSGNQNTGFTFSYYDGNFFLVNTQTTDTINLDVSLGTTSSVNTLLNTMWGSGLLDAVVTFYNSDSQSVVFDMTGGDVIRDYNSGSFQNGLTGSEPGYPGVTATTWWGTNASSQHLDVQTFTLPAAWNGTDLTEMTIYNPNTVFTQGDPLLSGLQVDSNPNISATPEPSSLVLLGTGILGLALAWRLRIARASFTSPAPL